MMISIATSLILVLTSILVMYEIMRLTSDHLSVFPWSPRPRIMLVVIAIFIGHTVIIFLYGISYWFLAIQLKVGGFAGVPVVNFLDCLYFSAVTYTSLGFGDHYPTLDIRLISGFEALNGLILIGWSATFTYLIMLRLWPMHKARNRKPHKR